MRPSLVVQYLCFVSLALAPWALVLGADQNLLAAAVASWGALGIWAAFWHRKVEEQ